MVDSDTFKFKQFQVIHDKNVMKVGTDGVLLGVWSHVEKRKKALDIGTGTGIIALILAQRNPDITIDGIEIDKHSAEEANLNFSNSPWSSRLQSIETSLQNFSKNTEYHNTFDLIVSNPPFFTGGTLSDSLSKNDVRHTRKLSHSDLLRAVNFLLVPEGRFEVVLPFMEGLRFIELAREYGLYLRDQTNVQPTEKTPTKRLLLSFSKQEGSINEDNLIIQKEKRNDWTDEYRTLVQDFYLDL